MPTKEEWRASVSEREALIAEGKSWFEYIRKDFDKLRQFAHEPRDDFFLAIGLLGNLAELDTDDVTYPGEGESDERGDTGSAQ